MNIQLSPAFVIAVVEGNVIKSYYRVPSAGDEYNPSFDNTIRQATIFDSLDKPIKIVEELVRVSLVKQKPNSNGTIYPATDIHRLLGLSNAKKSGSADLLILRLHAGQQERRITITGEIKEPTGFTYD